MSEALRAAIAFAFFFGVPAAFAAPARHGQAAGGVFVFEDTDPSWKEKEEYDDSLSYIDGSGKLVFRTGGLNVCVATGPARMAAYDAARGHVWVAEYGGRIFKFDPAGKELARIERYNPFAIAVDPESGNLWVILCGRKFTVVLDPAGKELAEYKATGSDIAYDAKEKAFWLAGNALVKLSAADGKQVFRKEFERWIGWTLAVHSETGRVWVAGFRDRDFTGSQNELRGFDSNGTLKHTIDLGAGEPHQVAIHQKTGAVWVTELRTGVRRYSADARLELDRKVEALAVHPDSATGELWVVTPDATLRLSAAGTVALRVERTGLPRRSAWLAGS